MNRSFFSCEQTRAFSYFSGDRCSWPGICLHCVEYQTNALALKPSEPHTAQLCLFAIPVLSVTTPAHLPHRSQCTPPSLCTHVPLAGNVKRNTAVQQNTTVCTHEKTRTCRHEQPNRPALCRHTAAAAQQSTRWDPPTHHFHVFVRLSVYCRLAPLRSSSPGRSSWRRRSHYAATASDRTQRPRHDPPAKPSYYRGSHCGVVDCVKSEIMW